MTSSSSTLLDDVAALIRMRSANPPGDEAEAARYVAERMRGMGADVELQEVQPGRLNAVGHLRFGPGPVLMMNSHLDVVPSDNPAEQFEPTVRDGRLYGRGACDAKGAVGAMLAACERLLAADRPRGGTLILAAVIDEEVGGAGTRHLVGPADVHADVAIVGEPTDNAISLACRGAYRARVRAHGRAAHSSDPARGANAIYAAARLALEVEQWNLEVGSRPAHGAASATVIQGGTKVNIVPESCEIQIDRRLGPGEVPETDGAAELEVILRRLQARDPEVSWSVELVGTPKPSASLDPTHPFADLALRTLGQTSYPVFRGGTDAIFLAGAGIPSLILGPGSLDQAHTADEWVGTDDLESAARTYERLARAVFSGLATQGSRTSR